MPDNPFANINGDGLLSSSAGAGQHPVSTMLMPGVIGDALGRRRVMTYVSSVLVAVILD